MVNQRTVRTLFCCVLLSSNILTDAYGLSKQDGNNNKGESQAPVAKKHLKHSTAAVRNNEISNDRPVMKTQSPKMVTVHETLKPEDQLILEITELKRMHQQLVKETNKGSNDAKKLQLLKHIEKQIQIRQVKQQQKQRKSQVVSGQNKHVTTARKVPQLFTPKQSFAAHSNSGPQHNVLQALGQGNVAQQKVQHNIKLQQQEPHAFEMKRQGQLQTQTNNHLRPQSNRQRNNIVSASQIFLPHLARKGPLTVNSHQLNGTIVQQIPSQQAGILVPVSALSSHHILNGQGLLQDKIVLVNPMFNGNNFQAIANTDNSRAAPTTQLPKHLPTTTKTTTLSTTTTELPSTTVSTPPTTSTSATESTTVIDMETLEQTLLKRSMKKQELEIRKLHLEIRALQREERNNLPEMENDDLPQQRRRQFGRRRLMPPYIR